MTVSEIEPAQNVLDRARSSRRGFILKFPAFGIVASWVVGKPAALQALKPPLST